MDIKDIGYYDIEKKALDILMTKEKNKKLISKVYKKMLKQVEKDPMQNWFEININDYSPKEMRIIKRCFCDWFGFGFLEFVPQDKMLKQKTSINYTSSITSVGVLDNTSYTTKLEKTPIEKFYITWFDEEN